MEDVGAFTGASQMSLLKTVSRMSSFLLSRCGAWAGSGG